uniref:G_PROTEIN_RECEP_F1_2 domain-containing protein n=1 Tax=Elaeophora elaphi TaxID=1147741 RepID=A0A0R3RLK7_9BILA
MLIQAAMVCGAIEVQAFCFYFLPQIAVKIAGNQAEVPINIFVNCYVIFNNAVLPTANLIFVKRFRDDVKRAIPGAIRKLMRVKAMNSVAPATLASFSKVQPTSRIQ